jgi:hypothetical protein
MRGMNESTATEYARAAVLGYRLGLDAFDEELALAATIAAHADLGARGVFALLALRARIVAPKSDSREDLMAWNYAWLDYRRLVQLAEDVLVDEHVKRTDEALAAWNRRAS